MNQTDILANMSPLPWRGSGVARLLLVNNDEAVANFSVSFSNVEDLTARHVANMSATLTAVSVTYGAGILPEEVEEMCLLLKECMYWDEHARNKVYPKIHDLFNRINNRNKC